PLLPLMTPCMFCAAAMPATRRNVAQARPIHAERILPFMFLPSTDHRLPTCFLPASSDRFRADRILRLLLPNMKAEFSFKKWISFYLPVDCSHLTLQPKRRDLRLSGRLRLLFSFPHTPGSRALIAPGPS